MNNVEKIYTADFETTTDINDCRVWATGICNVNNLNFEYGNSIEFLFSHFKKHNRCIYYFHNLKFDGTFIIYYLLKNGYTHIISNEQIQEKTFKTLISDMGLFYQIKIYFSKYKYVTIKDSLKLLNMSVEKIAKAFNLPISKLSINYEEKREINHKLTVDEIEYLKNDVKILAMALQYVFSLNMFKLTQGSNALHDLIETIGSKNFNYYFPKLDIEVDKDIRKSYKGGFTWCNPKFQNKEIKKGIVLDVNSLYPYVMYSKELPYKEPIYFTGKYEEDKKYPLFIQTFSCSFELKKNKIPTVQIKRNPFFKSTEYLSSSKDKFGNETEVTLSMTSVDLKLFLEHYEVYNIEYLYGYKFQSAKNIFSKYIDKWFDLKVKATLENNYGLRTWCKIMLNSVYGKFATSPEIQSKIPYLENDIVKYKLGDKEIKDSLYIPVATFITSYAREITIRSSQKCFSRILYCDTDSMHLIGNEIPKGIDVDNTKLGYWKLENKFNRAKFLRQKSYIEEIIDDNSTYLKVTCAGMQEKIHNKVNFENFEIGSVFKHQLKFKNVKGGVVLVDTDFSIK